MPGKSSEGTNASAFADQVGGDHYKGMAIQPAEFIIKNRIEGAESMVIKYICRWRKKGGLEDLRKARHWIDMLIEEAQGEIAK